MRGSWLSGRGCLWVAREMLTQCSYCMGTQSGIPAHSPLDSLSPMQRFSGQAQLLSAH